MPPAALCASPAFDPRALSGLRGGDVAGYGDRALGGRQGGEPAARGQVSRNDPWGASAPDEG